MQEITVSNLVELSKQKWALIKEHIFQTPLMFSPNFSQQYGCQVFLKLENKQLTNAFKIRGAFGKLLSLSPTEQKAGVVTASTGNHGIAMAYASQQLGISCEIFVAEQTQAQKVSRLREMGASVYLHGTPGTEVETYARTTAEQTGRIYVSAYNDLDIIASQGTIGFELLEQIPDGNCDAVFVPIGGGGLIAGIAATMKAKLPTVNIFGCQPIRSACMAESVKAGRLLQEFRNEETCCDAIAGSIEPGAITFPLCQKLVDRFICVEDEPVLKAVKDLDRIHNMIVETSSAITLACLSEVADDLRGKTVVLVLSGSNTSKK